MRNRWFFFLVFLSLLAACDVLGLESAVTPTAPTPTALPAASTPPPESAAAAPTTQVEGAGGNLVVDEDLIPALGRLPACEGTELYITAPVDISQITTITPLGNLYPGGGHVFPTRHLYWNLTGEQPLLAPGKIVVTSIRAQENITDGYSDYSILFSPCQEFSSYFLHVTSLSEELLAAYDQGKESYGCDEYETGGKQYRNCVNPVEVSLEAGEVMGAVGENIWHTFDFGSSDSRTPELAFANRDRWAEGWDTLHVVCALDYFSPEVRSALYAKLGGWEGKPRTVEPICGVFEQDEPGTAQGVWFVKGTVEAYPEDLHLSLVHDNVDPTIGAFSVGISLSASGLSPGVFQFTPKSSGLMNRDFDEVRDDGSAYCYETDQGGKKFVILLQLTDPTHLRIEKLNRSSCGIGPWSFTTDAAEFER